MTWSAWVVFIMSVIRYLATVKPLYYRSHITTFKVHVAIYGSLAFTLVQMMLPLFGATAPYHYYEDNFVCAYNFAPGAGGVGHHVSLTFLSVEGLVAAAASMFLNFSIVYEVI